MEAQQRAAYGLRLGIGEAKRGGSLRVNLDGPVEFLEGIFRQQAVVTDLFHLEQTAIGLETDLPQCGQVAQTLADIEVAGVVDGGFGGAARGLPCGTA